LTLPNRNHKHGNDPAGQKWCPGHQDFLPVGQFGKSRVSSDGLANYCKKCIVDQGRRARAKTANYKLHVWTCQRRGLQPLSEEKFRSITSRTCSFGKGSRPTICIGVDRVVSTRDYPDNSQPACPFHNNLKGVTDDDLFRIFLSRHPEYQPCSNSRVIHKSRQARLNLTPPLSPPAANSDPIQTSFLFKKPGHPENFFCCESARVVARRS
jgi:hypothetical protein